MLLVSLLELESVEYDGVKVVGFFNASDEALLFTGSLLISYSKSFLFLWNLG